MKIDTRANYKTRIDYLIFILSVIYFILISEIPFFAQITNPYLSMMIIVFLFIVIVITNPGRYIFFMIPLLGVAFLETFYMLLYDISSVPMFLYGRIIWLLPALISYFAIKNNDKGTIKIILYLAIGGLLLTSLTSIIGLINDPMAARNNASISDSKSEYAIYLNMKNIGGFKFAYTIPVIYPMLVCLFKYKKIGLILFLTITGCFGMYIFLTQYALATIAFAGAIGSLLFLKKHTTKRIIGSVVLLIVLFLLFKPFFIDVLYDISNNINSLTLSYRFRYIADILAGADVGNNEVQGRAIAYQYSIDAIKKHPISGHWIHNDGSRAGGHSFLLDVMAKYGLVGLFALIVFYYQILKKYYLPFKSEPFIGYMLYCFIISIFLGFFNPVGYLFTIAFIVPLIGYVIRDNNSNKHNQKNGEQTQMKLERR